MLGQNWLMNIYQAIHITLAILYLCFPLIIWHIFYKRRLLSHSRSRLQLGLVTMLFILAAGTHMLNFISVRMWANYYVFTLWHGFQMVIAGTCVSTLWRWRWFFITVKSQEEVKGLEEELAKLRAIIAELGVCPHGR